MATFADFIYESEINNFLSISQKQKLLKDLLENKLIKKLI